MTGSPTPPALLRRGAVPLSRPRPRALLVGSAAALAVGTAVAVGGAAASVVGASDDRRAAADGSARARPVSGLERFYAEGPRVDCDAEGCGMGLRQVAFTVPSGAGRATYDAVVEVTFEHVSRGSGRHLLGARYQRVGGQALTSGAPGEYVVASSAEPATQTLRFLLRELDGGGDYVLELGARTTRRQDGATTVFRTSKLLVTVQLTRH